MEFSNLIRKRRSIREFQDTPIDPQLLECILEALNRAPSAGNLQAYDIFIVERPDLRTALAQAARAQDFVRTAPLSLVFCAHLTRNEWKYKQRGIQLYAVQDATIACTYAMLAATDLGLGSVWVGAFDDTAVARVIGNPVDLRPVAVLSIGYPASEPPERPRRPLSDLVHRLDGPNAIGDIG